MRGRVAALSLGFACAICILPAPAAEAEGMNLRTILAEVHHAERELAEELEAERHGRAANLVSLAFGVLRNHHRLVSVVESRFARILVVVTARAAVEAGGNHLTEADEVALERGVRPVWAFACGAFRAAGHGIVH